MAAYQEIYQALTKSLVDLSLGLPIAYEARNYDPEKNGDQQYIRINTLYNDQESLDKSLYDEVTGIFQLSLYSKDSVSIANINSKIDALATYYKHNLKLINNSQCVTIINFGRNGGRNDNGWYLVDLSISFKSDIAR